MQFLFMTLMLMTATFLILLVLVQRGRGGGLTGALGGMGGQSAFGSKAGDLFTRITIGVAAFWIVLSVAAIKLLNTPETVFGDTDQTTFDDSSVPSLTTDAPEALPNETPATPTTDREADVPSSEPAAPEASIESPAPAPTATEEAATPAAESTEAPPEKEASAEKSE
jgi:preprotein translocase subunit SecG